MKQTIFSFILLLVGHLSALDFKPDLTVLIPMRDGKELTTDIYLPSTTELKNWPCILLRNPSGRKMEPWVQYAALAKEGYVVAVQDTRIVIDGSGKTLPYTSDGWGALQDGYDTVEWLSKAPFTNGRIGSVGFSAPGITQLLMAPSAPPSLKCQYVGIAAASIYDQAVFNGGQLLKNQVEGWLNWHKRDESVLSYVVDQPFYNDFWKALDSTQVAEQVTVPAIHYGGWFDPFLDGTINAFVSRQSRGGEGAKGKQKLLIGPWTHHWPRCTDLGDFTVPESGYQPPIDLSAKRWFDHYLKEQENMIKDEAHVTYYVMGPFDGSDSIGNVWRTSDVWPVPAEEKTFYLSSAQGLTDSAQQQVAGLSYRYDPDNPAPTSGGRNLFIESGPKDQSSIEGRSDVLVFTTPTFAEDTEVTGHLQSEIFFSSDCPDTDVVVKVTDVYPDGKSVLIADGICRLAYAKRNIVGDVSNFPLPVTVDLGATSMVFAKGHALRLSVTSSNYPRYEKNLNVGIDSKEKQRIARNTVFVGKKYPSKIVIPVVNFKALSK